MAKLWKLASAVLVAAMVVGNASASTNAIEVSNGLDRELVAGAVVLSDTEMARVRGEFYPFFPSGWANVTNGQLIPYYLGVMSDYQSSLSILNNTAPASLQGATYTSVYPFFGRMQVR